MVKLKVNAYLSGSSTDSAEYQVVKIKTKTKEIHLVNYYCPNNINLDLLNIPVVSNNLSIVGDFNSHSQSWGYNHIDTRGEEIEGCQDDNNLTLVNKPTFYSRCWHTTSTPDIAICTADSRSTPDALHNQSEPHLSKIYIASEKKEELCYSGYLPSVVSTAMRWLTNLPRGAAMTQHETPSYLQKRRQSSSTASR